MCGIAGAYSTTYSNESMQLVQSVVAAQYMRGPDHQAVEVTHADKSAVILGHNRLSIIDLSDSANQPLWDVTGQYGIVFNGEIYNYIELRTELIASGHQFKTTSDTEIILNAFKQWGIASLNKFNGPFAFALFDKAENCLWLARDRFGVKPLFYYIKNETIYFASTSSELANHFNLAPNMEYVARGLNYYVYEDDTELTPYLSLQCVPAACCLKINIASGAKLNYRLQRYYDLAERVSILQEQLTTLSTRDLVAMLSHKLQQAVDVRLRADVPIGISLSGGLDSSSVAALIAGQKTDFLGFTFGHPETKSSEGPIVAGLASRLNLAVQYIAPNVDDMVNALPSVLRCQDAPFSSLSIIAQYLIFQRVRKTGIKVILGGQGGDEAFMGYRKFHFFRLQQLFHHKKYGDFFISFLQLFPLALSELKNFKLYWSQRHRYLKQKHDGFSLQMPPSPSISLGLNLARDSRQRQLHDVTKFSLPTLLRYEDRNSLGNSVESRLPFLDYEVIEFGLALPEVLKLRRGYGKWILRACMHKKIPENIRSVRYKRGFDVPRATLINSGLGKSIRTMLADHYGSISEYIPRGNKIDILFSDQQLLLSSSRIAEAISLLWLGKCYL